MASSPAPSCARSQSDFSVVSPAISRFARTSLFHNKAIKDCEEHLQKAPPSNFTQQVSNPFKAATPQQHKFLSLTHIHVFVTKDLSKFPPKRGSSYFQETSQTVILWFATRLKYKLNKKMLNEFILKHIIFVSIYVYTSMCVCTP